MIVRTPKCCQCGENTLVEIPVNLHGNYMSWRNGTMFIQDAFPMWDRDRREMLITGTHPACWDKMFADEDE